MLPRRRLLGFAFSRRQHVVEGVEADALPVKTRNRPSVAIRYQLNGKSLHHLQLDILITTRTTDKKRMKSSRYSNSYKKTQCSDRCSLSVKQNPPISKIRAVFISVYTPYAMHETSPSSNLHTRIIHSRISSVPNPHPLETRHPARPGPPRTHWMVLIHSYISSCVAADIR